MQEVLCNVIVGTVNIIKLFVFCPNRGTSYDYTCVIHRISTVCAGVYIYTRKTGPPSRRTTWSEVSDSVQEIEQMQMQSTYWLEKVLKMISLYVSALLCTLQDIDIHAMQLSGVNSEN